MPIHQLVTSARTVARAMLTAGLGVRAKPTKWSWLGSVAHGSTFRVDQVTTAACANIRRSLRTRATLLAPADGISPARPEFAIDGSAHEL